MDIKQLKRFLDLCETKSFTKTAENLFLSQQALSSCVNALEEELGKPLFKRTPKGVVLTDEGTYLRDLCLPVVQSFDDMSIELSQQFHRKKGKLMLGLAPGVLRASSADLIFRFRTAFPNYEVSAIEAVDTVCVKNVEDEVVDIAFCPRPPDDACTKYIHLGTERLYAVVNKNSPLAQKDSVSLDDLKGERLVSLNKYHQIHRIILAGCQCHGFTPEFLVETGEISILLGLVKLNQCVFICMEYVTMDMETSSCVAIPLSDQNMGWEYGLLYKKGKKLGHHAKQFIEFMSRSIEEQP